MSISPPEQHLASFVPRVKPVVNWASLNEAMGSNKAMADRFLQHEPETMNQIMELMRRKAKPIHSETDRAWVTSEEDNDHMHVTILEQMPPFEKPFQAQQPSRTMLVEALKGDGEELEEKKKRLIMAKFVLGVDSVLADMDERRKVLLTRELLERPPSGGGE